MCTHHGGFGVKTEVNPFFFFFQKHEICGPVYLERLFMLTAESAI